MARPFFLSTSQFRAQHVALYDFVHGTTAALWNTRWQVGGYLAAVPDASKEDIDSRFVRGSGIRGVNVRRTFVEQTWDEHRGELARVALVNTVALYEGWLAALSGRSLGFDFRSSACLDCQSSQSIGTGVSGGGQVVQRARPRWLRRRGLHEGRPLSSPRFVRGEWARQSSWRNPPGHPTGSICSSLMPAS